MTISAQTRTAGPFSGTGLIVSYPFGFKVFQTSDVLAFKADSSGNQTTLALGTDYTVTLNSDQNAAPGGFITPLVALPIGYTLTATSNLTVTQNASLTNAGGFFPKTIEDALDRLTILMQQQGFVGLGQTLRVPELSGVPLLASANARANNLLGFDSSGNPVVVIPGPSGTATTLAIDLLNSAVAGKGAGQIAFNSALTYGAGTVGRWLTDLATSAGSALIGFLQAGTGAVLRTLQSKARETVSVSDFGVTGDGVADDTTKVQAALNSGASVVVIPAAVTVGVSALTMVAGQTLEVRGKIKKLSGTSPAVLMTANCKVLGFGMGEINGNGVAAEGITASGSTGLVVDGMYVHDTGGKAITFYAGCTKYRITNNRIFNCTVVGAALNVEYSNSGTISDNQIDTAYHGIVFYGGDANVSTVVGGSGITITGNVVKNITKGGIWGTLHSHVSMTGNHANTCGDVCFDFEGCSYCTCSGNTALEGFNACYSIFYGCTHITFTGNTGVNLVANGAGFFARTNTTYSNNRINLVGNNFKTVQAAINATANLGLSFSNSSICDNHILTTGGGVAMGISENSNLLIDGNHTTTVGGAIGIQLNNVMNSVVRNNWMVGFSDPGVGAAASGGIRLFAESAALPSQGNTIFGNRIDGYIYSIVDNCTFDVTKSKNDIQWNKVLTIYRSVGGTYNGVILNNLDVNTPATTITNNTF